MFSVVCVGFVFFGEFCLGFYFTFWCFPPETVRKFFFSCQVFCFGFVLSFLGFSGRRRFCLPFCFCFTNISKRESSGSQRTPHTPCTFWVFCFCSRRICVIARFGRASFVSGVFLGVAFWAPSVVQILSDLAGLELARPL